MLVALCLLLPAALDGGPSDDARVVLVWGGGKDAAAAAEWKKRWDEERAVLGEALVLGADFPRSLSSATLSGLNPGFEIVVLGLCRPEQGRSERAFLKHLYPFLYEKPVRAADESCPKWSDGQPRDVQALGRARSGKVELHAVEANAREGGEDMRRRSYLRVVARDAQGRFLGSEALDDSWNESQHNGCESDVQVRKKDVVVLRTCTREVGAFCNRYPGEKVRIVFEWDAERLSRDERTLSSWEINIDKECAE